MNEIPGTIEELMFAIMDQCKFIFFPEQHFPIFMDCSKNEVFALFFLYRKKRVNMSQIAEYMNVPLNTVTGVVNRLEKKQLVLRERSEKDKRVVTISMSGQGKALLDLELKKADSYFVKVMEALDEEEKRSLFKIADKVLRILNLESKPVDDAKKRKVKKILIE